MGKDTTSRTEKTSFIEERLFGDHHHETTIRTGNGTEYKSAGRTSQESQQNASDRYHGRK